MVSYYSRFYNKKILYTCKIKVYNVSYFIYGRSIFKREIVLLMTSKNSQLNNNGISLLLSNQNLDVDVLTFNEIDSTNSEAKRIAKNGFDKSQLIVANCQTAGRGRLGRNFFSPKDTGLYFTFLFKPLGSLSDSVVVTTAAAVAVVRSIEKLTKLKPMIKWVNDIYIDGFKVCGILTEAFFGSIAVGIGINISTKQFPLELQEKAGSLNLKNLDRNLFCAEIVLQLNNIIKSMNDRTFIAEYKAHSLVLGKRITFQFKGEEFFGTAIDIDDNGGLVVDMEDGTQRVLNTGEISIKSF